jgi:hypothetical protein
MGANNLKYENEYMSIPNFIPGISPVKTEADPTLMTGIASQLGQLVLAVSQMHQFIQGQAFARAAPQLTDVAGVAENVRQLSARLDDLEARVAKG